MTVHDIQSFVAVMQDNEELIFDGDMMALCLWSYYEDGSKSLVMIWHVA